MGRMQKLKRLTAASLRLKTLNDYPYISENLCKFLSLTLRYGYIYDISSPQTAVMAIWGL